MRRMVLTGLVVPLGLLLEAPAMSDQNDPKLAELFLRLSAAASQHEAVSVEQEIWSLWLDCNEARVDTVLARGMAAMETGDFGAALLSFDSIVQTAPNFAEGWNKRATLHYLMGALDESVADIQQTLALEPRHFGALSGLAMIREVQGRPFEALEALEQVSRLYPRLPHLDDRVARLTLQLGDPI